MDEELKEWLRFWLLMGCILFGIVGWISSCTAYTNKHALDALKAGASGIDVNIAIGRNSVKHICEDEKKADK